MNDQQRQAVKTAIALLDMIHTNEVNSNGTGLLRSILNDTIGDLMTALNTDDIERASKEPA